jgi:anaerobic C4-dicarboxylate transporter
MSNKQSIAVIILCILGLSWLSYTIIDQQKQIEQLKQELQQEQFKYKMLYRDPIVREAIESGG